MNKLDELWSLLDWATCGKILGKLASFKRYYAKPIEAARDKDASVGIVQHGKRVNEELQAVIRPYFIQRLKIDVLHDKLPKKIEMVVWTHLSQLQRSMYTEYIGARDSVVRLILTGAITSPLEAVTHLKKLAAHPLLAQKHHGADLKILLGRMSKESIISQSAKLGILVELVQRLRDEGHHTLIFSQSVMMLDIIQAVLDDVRVSRIDGQTKEQDRQRFVDDFNKQNGNVDVMLLSTKAAGVGLTLTGADRVIVYDPAWTPAEDSQAVDRCYRIGQKREVLVYRLIAAGTVEEKMYEKQIHKDGIRRTVLTEIESVQRYFTKQELSELFTLAPIGACAVMEKVSNVQTDWTRHKFMLAHRGVVGLSRHDGFYAATSQNENAPKPFSSAIENRKEPAVGRAQRVLMNESKEAVQLRRSTPDAPTKASDELPDHSLAKIPRKKRFAHDDRASISDGGKENKHSSNSTEIKVMLNRAKKFEAQGMQRRLLQLLLEIRELHYADLTPTEKMNVQTQIANVSYSLGLLTIDDQLEAEI